MTDPGVELAELEHLARKTWNESQAGDVIWLVGELGAGKTTFACLVCAAAGAEGGSSPTYSLVQEYQSSQGVILHADCYRLSTPSEAVELDLVDQARRARLTMIEWPERGGPFVPEPRVTVQLSHASTPDRRQVEVLS